MTFSSNLHSRLLPLLANWFSGPLAAVEIKPIAEQGFSGARVFRVLYNQSEYCMKHFPLGVSVQRLRDTHSLLKYVSNQGLRFVPVPLTDSQGDIAIEQPDGVWQLEPWMPGLANFWQFPTPVRLRSAFESLAQWHRVSATIGWTGNSLRIESQVIAPTVDDRIVAMQRYAPQVLFNLESALLRESHSDWRILGRRLVLGFRQFGPKVLSDLQTARNWLVDLQPVIRDVWHDHLLFTGDQLTGLIDYGAVRTDTVAADISRMLGSLLGDQPEHRQIALTAYESVRSLSPNELRLIPVLDRSNVLLSGMTWLRSRYLEGATITAEQRVLTRLDRLSQRVLAWSYTDNLSW